MHGVTKFLMIYSLCISSLSWAMDDRPAPEDGECRRTGTGRLVVRRDKTGSSVSINGISLCDDQSPNRCPSELVESLLRAMPKESTTNSGYFKHTTTDEIDRLLKYYN